MYLGHPNGGKYLRVAVMPDPCGEGDQRITQSIDIVPGTDDVTFLLNTMPLQVCNQVLGRIEMPLAGQTNKDVEGGVGDSRPASHLVGCFASSLSARGGR